jgi:hypothetical protein
MGDRHIEVDGADPSPPLDLGEDTSKVVVSHSPGR